MAHASGVVRRACSTLPPPPAQENEDQDDNAAYEAKPEPHGRGLSRLEPLEGLLPHQGADYLAGTCRTAAGDDIDVVEDQQRVDDRQQHHEHERGPYSRQRHVQELLPAARTVHPRRLVEIVIHRLQCGQKQQHDKAPPGPDVDEGDRRQGEALAPEEGDPVEKGYPYRGERRSYAPAGIEDVLPDRTVDDAGNNVRNEVGDPEEELEAFYLREQERPEQAHRDRDGEKEDGPDDVVPHGDPEVPVGEKLRVVLQPHELCGSDPRPIGERVVDGGHGGPEDDEKVDGQQWDHK